MIVSHELFVLEAYDMNANGDLHAAFDPMPMDSEQSTVQKASILAARHDGVVVWKRSAEHGASRDHQTVAKMPNIGNLL